MSVHKDPYDNKGSFKYFIGYKRGAGVVPLCIKLPQLSGYAKYFDKGNRCISFMINDEKLLTKYNKIWDKVRNLFKKGFDSEPLYNNKYIKTKIKLYSGRINTNFQVNKIPEKGARSVCLSVILLDSLLLMNKSYYSQAFLEQYKYAVKR